ncbi:hypothetical protein SAY87_015863 [Trapa incisa]|uniref:DDE Tnp4 domain-containing protein n=1 Tax=Trapa incisa TaxID=236973 RepID=A0AAN7L504_9MYRT|nr:hypothetical protein SAY87_015863 [Trapa incisa]
MVMASARELKRRKTEKKSEPNVSSSSGSLEKHESNECWNNFSIRINAPLKGLDDFKFIFSVSRTTFDYICSLVEDDLMGRPPNLASASGKLLSLPDQVAVALRRLSSGESLVNVGDLFGLHHYTVSQITWRFVEAMEGRGLRHLRWPSADTEIEKIKHEFEKMSGLPNCCGAISTTHILMNLPATDPSRNTWLDPQKNHSMVLQAIVHPMMRFRDIVTGWPGKVGDQSVFQSSSFYQLCEGRKRLNGANFKLYDGSEIGEYIVGDACFPLLPYLTTPYDGDNLSILEREFNRRHLVTRDVARRAFTKLKDNWRIIRGMMWRPDKHKLPRIILVCCILHNIAIELEEDSAEDKDRHNLSRQGHDPLPCVITSTEGAVLRDKLSLYLYRKSLSS